MIISKAKSPKLIICIILLVITSSLGKCSILQSISSDDNRTSNLSYQSRDPLRSGYHYSLAKNQYEIRTPIYISSNNDFASQGFLGSGTSDDPYVISGFFISKPSGNVIEIADVDSYFIIRDNELNGKGGPEWGNGIALFNTNHGTIENNIITSCSANGIYLHQADNTLILNNKITRNSVAIGIDTGSDNTIVKLNTFIRHGGAYDKGLNNVFEYNYWDDWTSPDTNNDGIVDDPYSYIGGSGKKDDFPLPYPHTPTEPILIYPNGGETLNGTIEIQWTPSNDSFNHSVTYSVYYSANDGLSWNTLISSLNSTHYIWNTTTLSYGENYRIRVIAYCSIGSTSEDASEYAFTVSSGFSPPTFVPPSSQTVLRGITTVRWLPPEELSELNLSYSVFYSPDNGTTWNMIANSTTASYAWDTSTMRDGSEYKIKIEMKTPGGLIVELISDDTFTIENTSSLIGTIILPIPVSIVLFGLLFWLNRKVDQVGMEEEKVITSKE